MDPPAIAQFLWLGKWLISKIGVSRLQSTCDSIDLVAATIDILSGIIRKRHLQCRFRRLLRVCASDRLHRRRPEGFVSARSKCYRPWSVSSWLRWPSHGMIHNPWMCRGGIRSNKLRPSRALMPERTPMLSFAGSSTQAGEMAEPCFESSCRGDQFENIPPFRGSARVNKRVWIDCEHQNASKIVALCSL